MKFVLLTALLVSIASVLFAQKKLIDNTVFDKWPELQRPAISPDGKYAVYTVDKEPVGHSTLVIQSIDNTWKRKVIDASDASFSNDGSKIIYKTAGDSVCIAWLGTENCDYIPRVRACKFINSGNDEWVVLEMVTMEKELRLYNITDRIEKSFPHVNNYCINENGILLIQTDEQNGLKHKKTVEWVNLKKGKKKIIWQSIDSSGKGTRAEDLKIDKNGTQATFIKTEINGGKQERQLWYYKAGMEYAVPKLNTALKGIPDDCVIATSKFSEDGTCLFLELIKPIRQVEENSGVMVDIWSYTDDKLQAQQLKEVKEPCYYTSVINLDRDSLVIIQADNEKIYQSHFRRDDYALLATAPCYFKESNWRKPCRSSLYLVNTKTGMRELIKETLVNSYINSFSPTNKFVVFYDFEEEAYFSYDIKNGELVNISQGIPFKISDTAHARADLPGPFEFIQHWLPEDKGVVICDEYDIWQVDPEGKYSPICLTMGYGRTNKTVLRFLQPEGVITDKQQLVVAFRTVDKSNGFFRVKLGVHASSPQLLTMDPYLYYWPRVDGLRPIKAIYKDIWLVKRMNASEAPNYFVTKNFKSFHQLSDVHPQKDYNWLKAELHKWTTFDGKESQGILYQPENFDSSKKYPIIFHFYEEKSDELHKYLIPEATGSNINIPHFVSNGYLLFVPDIHYSIGEPIESVYNYVASAASYLSKYTWVDSTKLGLQGHSFGGYEVNALISRTNRFSAAASAAGASNLISNTGSIDVNGGNSLAYLSELMSYRMGGTIWEKLNKYIRNSPVLYADRINTPLLMFNCKADGLVPFAQGIEIFLALRRLDKPVWMLQYDNGEHQLVGDDAKDYTVRLMQFFDHYLRGSQMPPWMTKGIPAKLKGIATGFGNDSKENYTNSTK